MRSSSKNVDGLTVTARGNVRVSIVSHRQYILPHTETCGAVLTVIVKRERWRKEAVLNVRMKFEFRNTSALSANDNFFFMVDDGKLRHPSLLVEAF
jgi:hypothetical protein